MSNSYRVTWFNVERGEYDLIDVHSMRQAQQTAMSLASNHQNTQIDLSVFVPHLFHELTIRYTPSK